MSTVIDMRAWKAGHAPKPVRTDRATVPYYYCVRCGTEEFRLFESGLVRCAGCMADIGNVKARQL